MIRWKNNGCCQLSDSQKKNFGLWHVRFWKPASRSCHNQGDENDFR
jgi:hypothetical protein